MHVIFSNCETRDFHLHICASFHLLSPMWTWKKKRNIPQCLVFCKSCCVFCQRNRKKRNNIMLLKNLYNMAPKEIAGSVSSVQSPTISPRPSNFGSPIHPSFPAYCLRFSSLSLLCVPNTLISLCETLFMNVLIPKMCLHRKYFFTSEMRSCAVQDFIQFKSRWH